MKPEEVVNIRMQAKLQAMKLLRKSGQYAYFSRVALTANCPLHKMIDGLIDSLTPPQHATKQEAITFMATLPGMYEEMLRNNCTYYSKHFFMKASIAIILASLPLRRHLIVPKFIDGLTKLGIIDDFIDEFNKAHHSKKTAPDHFASCLRQWNMESAYGIFNSR